MRIGIYGRSFEPSGQIQPAGLFEHLELQGIDMIIEEDFFMKLQSWLRLKKDPMIFKKGQSLKGKIDYMLSIGGDGTMLDTVTIVRDSGIPVLGINTGKLGFLSAVTGDQFATAIRCLKEKRFLINKRSLIHVSSQKEYFGRMNFALNELSVHRRESPSLIAIQVWINDVFVNAYWADGLIISTPTGSTGYSMSCGGPIVYPQAASFIITPIASHNLTVRPLVIPDDKFIKVKVHEKYGCYTAGLDARYHEIGPGDDLIVSKEKFHLNLIQFEQEEFFITIREKLKWGLDTRN